MTVWRLLLILCLAAGMLLPRTGAALAEMVGFDTIVICRGDAMVTITLGADGAPVETEIEAHGPCLAAALPEAMALARLAWTTLIPVPAPRAIAFAPLPSVPWDGPPPERGPPSFV
ncbi:MAG: hypothetical protein AAF919_10185 [Pseudomonadota bacterium]